MSILIKGMKMPKGNAEYVEIYIYGDGTVFARQKITVNGRKINGVEAVELPPHGRLIDADALIRKVPDVVAYDEYGEYYLWYTGGMILGEPTIIEAEEAENDGYPNNQILY